jgi:hypothetical protein
MARRSEDDEKKEFVAALDRLKDDVLELDLQVKKITKALNSPPLCHKLPCTPKGTWLLRKRSYR